MATSRAVGPTITSSLMCVARYLFVAALIYTYTVWSIHVIHTKYNESYHPSKLCRLSPAAPPSLLLLLSYIYNIYIFLDVFVFELFIKAPVTLFVINPFSFWKKKTNFLDILYKYGIAVVIHFSIQQRRPPREIMLDPMDWLFFPCIIFTNIYGCMCIVLFSKGNI